ncbi:MAG: hypothetical protein IK020_06695 [Clostridiales bacterium]|nr:hypothetical protein [Clostridiales bacterium]MBR5974855.1 hypothetical protein [Clostridiales bacterium]
MKEVDDNSFDCKYVSVYVPDKAKLAFLIKEAKGPDRTMAEFAEACGTLSAPSFSRIIKGNIVKPLTVEVIQSIVKNAAPGANVEYYSLMRANGMIPAEVDDRHKKHGDEEYEYERELKNREIKTRNIVTDELLARGIMMQLIPYSPLRLIRNEEIPAGKFRLAIPASFSIRVAGEEQSYWFYKYVSSDRYWRNDIRDFSELFLRDLWEPETLKEVKVTFVFADKDHYEETLEKMKDIKINNYISFLLVDPENGIAMEEKMLPRYDGKAGKSIFDYPRMEADWEDPENK